MDFIRKMEGILSDSVNRTHDCVVGKFASLASIANEGTPRRAKMVDTFSERLANRQNGCMETKAFTAAPSLYRLNYKESDRRTPFHSPSFNEG